MHILTGVGALTALFLSVPLAAQAFTSQLDNSSQTVTPTIAVPPPRQINPILKLSIAPEKRGDLSDCSARSKRALDYIAETCWPVLQAYQALIRFKEAGQLAFTKHKNKATDAEIHKDRALVLAETLHGRNADARWPMQDYIVQSSYPTLIAMLREFGDHEAALKASDAYIALQGRSLMDRTVNLRGYIYKNKTEYLLDLGRRKEALANYVTAMALADREPIDMISYVEHAELVAYDAIIAKNEDRALDAMNLFLQKTERHSRHQDPVYYPVRILKIYILAGRKDADGVLAELQTFDDLSRRNLCTDNGSIDFYFPQVISPTQKDPRIAAELRRFGCSEEIIARMDADMADGVRASVGIKPLPPR